MTNKASTYDPNKFLDWLIKIFTLKNDAELSRKLEVAPPVISRIRHRKLPVGAALILKIHELSDLPAREIRKQLGVQ